MATKFWQTVPHASDLIAAEATYAALVAGPWFAHTTLLRTLVWWDVRYVVPEDYTGVPRSPVPYRFEIRAVDQVTLLPPPGDDDDPVVQGLMQASTTDAIGSHDPTDEIVLRWWQGGSGGLAIDSNAQRDARRYENGIALQLTAFPQTAFSSPEGFWQPCQLLITMLVATLWQTSA